MIIGYARVSTDDQSLDAQTDALTAAGAGKLFADKISGSKRERPELDRMLEQLRDGDVVTVTKYDRLARSLKDLLEIVEMIRERGATSTPRRRQAVWCFMFSRPSLSLSASGFPNEQKRGWRQLASVVALVAGPLPLRLPRRARYGA